MCFLLVGKKGFKAGWVVETSGASGSVLLCGATRGEGWFGMGFEARRVGEEHQHGRGIGAGLFVECIARESACWWDTNTGVSISIGAIGQG
jgi:hypothetical protein